KRTSWPVYFMLIFWFFFSSRRRHTRCYRDWSSDVCSSDLQQRGRPHAEPHGVDDDPVGGERGREIARQIGVPLGVVGLLGAAVTGEVERDQRPPGFLEEIGEAGLAPVQLEGRREAVREEDG